MVKGKVPQPTSKAQCRKSVKDNTTSSPAAAQGASTSAAPGNRGLGKHTTCQNGPSCNSCGKVITEETKALQCDKCQSAEGWKCADCLNLTGNVYEALVSENGPPLRWFCDDCDNVWKQPHIANLTSTMSLILDKLDRLQNKVERIESKTGLDGSALGKRVEEVAEGMDMALCTVNSQLMALTNKVEGITDFMKKSVITQGKVDETQLINKLNVREETVHKRLEEKVDDVMKAIGSQQIDAVKILEGAIKTQTEETRKEDEEKSKRKVNVIVHGLKEPTATSAAERENEDKDITEELLHMISCDTVSVRQATRLGALPQTTDPAAKPRPLRITFESEDSRDYVLKNAKNLRGKEGGWAKVFLHQDLTPKQREARKKLIQELQDRKKNGEQDLIIVNGTITKRRTQVERQQETAQQ